MTTMNSTAGDRNLNVVPIKVTFRGILLSNFRYPPAMSVGEVLDIGSTYELDIIHNSFFKFFLKKAPEKMVKILCERHVKKETLKDDDSAVEADALELDDGCFLRLYISVIGVNEKPKSAVLRSTDKSASVQFTEDSFLNPKVDVGYVYILKCVFRMVETTALPNKEHEVMWQKIIYKTCKSNRQKKNMAFVLECPNLDKVLTGRNDECFNMFANFVCRACCYHKELFQYFKAEENSKSIPNNVLELILGYLYTEEKKAITKVDCVDLYFLSQRFGLKFVKKLCAAYMTENLNDEFVIDVLIAADMTEDSRLFNAAWLYCMKNKLQLFNSDMWREQACQNPMTSNKSNLEFGYYLHTALSLVHGFLLRCFTDNLGFPPAMEDESGQP